MSLLEQIATAADPLPRRVMIYGPEGVGKSSFVSGAEGVVILQVEDGLSDIAAPRWPADRPVESWEEAIGFLRELYSGEHQYRAVAIDSLSALERVIHAQVATDEGVGSIGDIGFGRGYVAAGVYWARILDALEHLRRKKGMAILMVAHNRIESYQDPERESYSRHVPALHKHASALVCQWCDEILFASYRVGGRQVDEGFGRPRTLPAGSGERMIRTEERPSHVAKNRAGLPYEMALDYSEFIQAIGQEAK